MSGRGGGTAWKGRERERERQKDREKGREREREREKEREREREGARERGGGKVCVRACMSVRETERLVIFTCKSQGL